MTSMTYKRGWLIERILNGQPHWWSVRYMSKSAHPDDTSWTTSPDRAVRFAYREDAASYIECVFAPAVLGLAP